jgi:PAS domain-containing protein
LVLARAGDQENAMTISTNATVDSGTGTVELAPRTAPRTLEMPHHAGAFRRPADSDREWYWEQNVTGSLTDVSGPIEALVGLGLPAFLAPESCRGAEGYEMAERAALRQLIAARQPFMHFSFTHVNPAGSQQHFELSGEPVFDAAGAFAGYRGVGVEVSALHAWAAAVVR